MGLANLEGVTGYREQEELTVKNKKSRKDRLASMKKKKK